MVQVVIEPDPGQPAPDFKDLDMAAQETLHARVQADARGDAA